MASLGQRFFSLRGRQRTQILMADTVARGVAQNALTPVIVDHHAQHVVAFDQLIPRFFEAGNVDVVVALIPLEHHMARYATVLNRLRAAQPVSVLDRRQRERIVAALFIVMKRR